MSRRVVVVDPRDGEEARRALARAGWLDLDRRPAVVEGLLRLPLVAGAPSELDLEVPHQQEEADLEVRAPRPAALRDAPSLPPDLADSVTRSMDVVGDIAVLRLDESIIDRAAEVGRALLEVNPRLRAVALDRGVRGELRVRDLQLVAGEGPLVTVHREHGAELVVDLEGAYFSPRLATEHRRVADLVVPGERVLDMFSGVAPFAVLVARHAEPSEVHAVDLNPRAVELARENARRNGVADLVTVHLGDAREVVPGLGAFDRVVMNHPHAAIDFLDVAVGASGPGTTVHLHVIGTDQEVDEASEAALIAVADAGLPSAAVTTRREVRTYAPGVGHHCVDVRVGIGP